MRLARLTMTMALTALASMGLGASAHAQSYSPELFSKMQWRPIGPLRAGRGRAVAGVPSEPNIFYIGNDDGGVWKSADYGNSWQPIFDEEPTSSIGAIAVSLSDPNVVYVGTGEGNIRPDQSTGMGMYKSTDAGKTWSFIGLRATEDIAAIAVDPHDSNRVFVAALGHIYGSNKERGIFRSLDGGKTWKMALEDRHSQWLNDSSCAFDANHTAFFLAPAAKVIDDAKHLELGTTRLYLSTDSGEHWTKECKTTWLDYSASAVSADTHFLVAFFNDGGTYDEGRAQGSSVAALYFIPGRKNLLGPILDPGMKQMEYQGAFPSNAVGIGKGRVAALYFGGRKTSGDMEYDLGIVRFNAEPRPSVSYTVITSEKKCLSLDGSSLAYDPQKNLLLAVYGNQTPGGCRLMLATSTNLGESWEKQPIENSPAIPAFGVDHLSLALDPRGVLGVLWESSGSSAPESRRARSPPTLAMY